MRYVLMMVVAVVAACGSDGGSVLEDRADEAVERFGSPSASDDELADAADWLVEACERGTDQGYRLGVVDASSADQLEALVFVCPDVYGSEP